ncbi:MAG: dihydropyrimidinase [Candidatus Heimdallarchaeota archaeon]|nr:dihydropyrimidinase [Candidatus Heimdallarchaeota archaeon]
METIIKGGTIVTAHEKYEADIGIKGGKIAAIGANLEANGAAIIDATDKLVMPGMIDSHVHLSLPFGGSISADSWQTGTRAAAAGGITTVIDFAIPKDRADSLTETVNNRKAEAENDVFVDFSLHGAITRWDDESRKEIGPLCEAGITTFKMFMVYRSIGWLSTDPMIVEALEETKKHGGMVQVHAESVDLIDSLIENHSSPEEMKEKGAYLHTLTRPQASEYEAIQRAITWAEYTGGNLYIVHMSTGRGAEMVTEARKRGVNVIGETCPQYLHLDDSVFSQENGHYYATQPQLKTPEDGISLWKGLNNSGLSVVGTDTCTFNTEQKALWEGNYTKIPMGMPGSELMVPLIYEGVRERKLDLHRMVAVMSENPAKVLGMYPKKGALLPGSDADVVIFDEEKQYTVDYKNMETNCDWSPYQGKTLTGMPVKTILRGKVIAEDGKCVGEKGFGEFIKRGPSGNFVE